MGLHDVNIYLAVKEVEGEKDNLLLNPSGIQTFEFECLMLLREINLRDLRLVDKSRTWWIYQIQFGATI